MYSVARELTIDAAQAAGSSRLYSGRTRELSTEQIKKLLDSRFEKEVLEGLRRVVSVSHTSSLYSKSSLTLLDDLPG